MATYSLGCRRLNSSRQESNQARSSARGSVAGVSPSSRDFSSNSVTRSRSRIPRRAATLLASRTNWAGIPRRYSVVCCCLLTSTTSVSKITCVALVVKGWRSQWQWCKVGPCHAATMPRSGRGSRRSWFSPLWERRLGRGGGTGAAVRHLVMEQRCGEPAECCRTRTGLLRSLDSR